MMCAVRGIADSLVQEIAQNIKIAIMTLEAVKIMKDIKVVKRLGKKRRKERTLHGVE